MSVMYDTPIEENHTNLPHDLPLVIGNVPILSNSIGD